jgi:hypothetical protein
LDVEATQLPQRIEQTLAALAATPDLLERHVSQRVAAVLEQAVIGSGERHAGRGGSRS